MKKKIKSIFFFTKYGSLSASTRERFNNFIPILKKNKIYVKKEPLITDKLLKLKIIDNKNIFLDILFRIIKRTYQIIFIEKKLLIIQYELITYFPSILEFYLKIRKIPFIIDLDDIVYVNYNKNFLINFLYKNKFKKIFKWSSGIIVGNRFLEKEVKSICKTEILYIPTTVNLNTKKYKKHKDFTVVWIGSPSTTKYINDIKDVIEYLSINENIKFKIIGSKNSIIKKNPNIKFLNWSKKKENIELSSSHLGIMPLRNSLWEKGKCGYKLLQYMSCSLPVVASPVSTNLEIVQAGKSGYFAKNKSEWIDYILKFKKNIKLRAKYGKYGKEILKKDYDIRKFYKKYFELIDKKII